MFHKLQLAFSFLILCSTVLVAQENYLSDEYIYKSYDWNAVEQEVELTKTDSSEAAVILLDRTIKEFRTKRFNQDISGVITRHFKVWINTEEGLENHNKVFIPIKDGQAILELKARSIDPNGVVTDFDRRNLKDISNVQEYGSFKIFAIEGAVTGSIIEYYYTVPLDLQYTYKEYAQGEYPVKHFSFLLKSTRDLHFHTYVNNGLNEGVYQEEGNFNLITFEHQNIPPIKEEPYSTYRANRMNMDITLKSFFRLILADGHLFVNATNL